MALKLRIPSYVEGRTGKEPLYRVRPLFFPHPVEQSHLLARATSRLREAVRQRLNELRKAEVLGELARWTWSPKLSESLVNLSFEHKKRTAKIRLLLVSLKALERTLYFTPSLPDLWFDGPRLEEVVRTYLRQRENKDVEPESLSVLDKAWLSHLELTLELPGVAPMPRKPSLLAIMGGADVGDGAEELAKVGRCLDYLYPDQLETSLGTGAQLERLTRLIEQPRPAAVVVVGPRLVGKTALIHQYVRHVRGRKKKRLSFWYLTPQRLISGMSHVGQWETRVVRILKHAAKKNLVLVLDDLVGLTLAGISRDAKLSVADVLRPVLEQRQVRVLAEITPSAFAVLRERDRPLADLFEVVALEEMAPRGSLSVALEVARKAEASQRCEFKAEALLAVESVCRRFVSDAVFPGKAALMLRQLAARYRERKVGRREVLEQFHQRTGVALYLLDDRVKLARHEILQTLERRVIGQPEALEACADAVSIAKARLSDPGRPVAGLLFLGPTGVGKTECARALAAYLYGDEGRLLRFDMNEYVGFDAVARLVGSPHQPEGLMTSALRRQPFSVVLLDEVEKAHPDVLQLLLQILGDGRLTDALGRTADFTQSILILTSNLGAEEATRPLGLRSQEEGLATVYRRAAESFFTPELFNRLDRIVPFRRLGRAEVAVIADGLVRRVLGREGLHRRQCILQLDPTGLEKLVEEGFHPQLGARALKRAVEARLTVPVARRLAEMPPDTPTILSIGPGLEVRVEPLAPAPARDQLTSLLDGPELVKRLEAAMKTWKDELARYAPEGPVEADSLTPEQLFYFTCQDQLRRLEGRLRSLGRKGRRSAFPDFTVLPREQAASVLGNDLLTPMRAWGEEASRRTDTPLRGDRLEALHAAALLQALIREGPQGASGEVRIPLPHEKRLEKGWHAALAGLELSPSVQKGVLHAAGPGAETLMEGELGVHLFAEPQLSPLRLGEAGVVRVYTEFATLDLTTGLLIAGPFKPDHMGWFLKTALPLEV